MVGRQQRSCAFLFTAETLRVKRHQRHDECCRCVATKKTVALGQDNASTGVGRAKGGAEARRSAADNQNVRLGSKLRRARRQVDETRTAGTSKSWHNRLTDRSSCVDLLGREGLQ